MEGANEYAPLFKTGQYGRLYIVSSFHARGDTFRIQVLPEGEAAIPNGSNNSCLNKDAVEVYGIISGNAGWTEKYGWLHQGKWCDDFESLVAERKKEIEIERNSTQLQKDNAEQLRLNKINNLLSKY